MLQPSRRPDLCRRRRRKSVAGVACPTAPYSLSLLSSPPLSHPLLVVYEAGSCCGQQDFRFNVILAKKKKILTEGVSQGAAGAAMHGGVSSYYTEITNITHTNHRSFPSSWWWCWHLMVATRCDLFWIAFHIPPRNRWQLCLSVFQPALATWFSLVLAALSCDLFSTCLIYLICDRVDYSEWHLVRFLISRQVAFRFRFNRIKNGKNKILYSIYSLMKAMVR